MNEAQRIRRATVVRLLRSKKNKQLWKNMRVSRLFIEMARMKMSDQKQYAPKIPPKQKAMRIVVEDLKRGCDHCLNKPAIIYSAVFKQNLCLDCEEKLTVDAGAMVFDKLKKKEIK